MIILFRKVCIVPFQSLLEHDINRQSQNMMSTQYMNSDYYRMYSVPPMPHPQNGGLPPPYSQSTNSRIPSLFFIFIIQSLFRTKTTQINSWCPHCTPILISSLQTFPRSASLHSLEPHPHHPAKSIFPPKLPEFAAQIDPQRANQIARRHSIRLHRRGVTHQTGSFVPIPGEFHRRNVLPPVLHELFRGDVGTNEALDSAVDMMKPPLFPSQFKSFDVRNSGLFFDM